MSTLSSVFIGVPQSRYAAIAILLAIVFVSATILFGKDSIPLSQKFGFVLLVFLVSLPSLLMSLFQITCLVTGAGFKNQRWWCSLYAWIVSALMILYAVMLIVAAILTLTATEPPPVKSQMHGPVDMAQANKVGGQYFNNAPPSAPQQQNPAAHLSPSPSPHPPSPSPSPKPPSISPFTTNGGASLPSPFIFSSADLAGAPIMEAFADMTKSAAPKAAAHDDHDAAPHAAAPHPAAPPAPHDGDDKKAPLKK